MVSNLVILTWDFFYWFLLLSEIEEKNNFLTSVLVQLWTFSVLVHAQMRAYICTCPSVFVLPRLLLYMSVLSCLHESDLSYQGTNILCLHHTMQSVIIIIKNKPKQNPSRYEISVKIRCYFCQLWASSEVLYSRMFVPDKVLLFSDTWVLFNVWRFFNLVFFF